MPTYAAFLRAVNVGGRKLPMADLRAALTAAGYEDVSTYVQSGNVILSASGTDTRVAAALEELIAAGFGLETRVMVRTHAELEAIEAANPFPDEAAADGRRVHVVLLSEAPTGEAVARIDPGRSPHDRFEVIGKELYVHYPDGAGRTRLTLDYLERRLGAAGTGRNWNTLRKLVELTRA